MSDESRKQEKLSNGRGIDRRTLLTMVSGLTAGGVMMPSLPALAGGVCGAQTSMEVSQPTQLQFDPNQVRSAVQQQISFLVPDPDCQNNLMTAFESVLAGVIAFDTRNILCRVFDFGGVLTACGLPPLIFTLLLALILWAICVLWCPLAPRNPPPGTTAWFLIGWYINLDLRLVCVYVCI